MIFPLKWNGEKLLYFEYLVYFHFLSKFTPQIEYYETKMLNLTPFPSV